MAKTTKPPEEPVNSEQLDAALQKSATPNLDAAAGPSVGELEEQAVEAQNRAEAAERENAALKEMIARLEARMKGFEEMAHSRAASRRKGGDEDDEELLPGEKPVFDENAPHGVVMGDPRVGFVQNGYQFDRARQYVGREEHRGVPRAFNPKLVGWVRPRPGAQLSDPLEGIRDQ